MTDWRLPRMRGRHRGESCVLVANGPSLNRMDLRFLRSWTVIGLNKIFLGFAKFSFYPRYYVAVNPKVIDQSASQIRSLNCTKFIDDRVFATGVLAVNALTIPINEQVDRPFSADLTCGYHQGATVTHAALQVAYHLGFSQVILIGLDHRYSFDGRPGEAKVMKRADPNHFSHDYFARGQSWDNPELEKSEFHYRAAREAFEADGRRIIDATLEGACTIFEKADYKRLFSF